MKFTEFKYERPDFEAVTQKMNGLLDELEKEEDPKAFLEIFNKINVERNHIHTMSSLSHVRHTINTSDEFYEKENEFWDNQGPLYQVLEQRLSKIVLAKEYREELLKEIPAPYFLMAEQDLKTFDEKIIPLLQEENQLASAYAKLKASCKIEFDGKILNLPQIGAETENTDRDHRKRAVAARSKWLEENELEFDTIYHKLVQLRQKIATALGFENFIELGYYRMNRLDYNAEMVSVYRDQVLKQLVPLASNLFKKQQERLGVDRLAYYDLPINFLSGNPTPKGTTAEKIQAAKEMYYEMSPETKEFIDVMINQELWDLENKPNKAGGGYCTTFPDYKVPFIFSNFNGTSGDVDVLTHEAGHAFQMYLSRDISVPECANPTLESCEIHSMSMEFFAWPWMEKFFKEDADKYYYTHLASAIQFIPYGILVDHYQHEVYANPSWTIEERKACWRKLEKQYTPWKDYTGYEGLERGSFWHVQGHIFQSPFYYIDYTLAQVCALQFWVRQHKEDPKAWQDYLHLCKLGGTKSFVQLVKEAGLKSPFEEGCLDQVSKTVNDYLETVDDKKM
ncbi:MAG: M3 family oligoendopeptidase [Anaerorhabdus sp.]